MVVGPNMQLCICPRTESIYFPGLAEQLTWSFSVLSVLVLLLWLGKVVVSTSRRGAQLFPSLRAIASAARAALRWNDSPLSSELEVKVQDLFRARSLERIKTMVDYAAMGFPPLIAAIALQEGIGRLLTDDASAIVPSSATNLYGLTAAILLMYLSWWKQNLGLLTAICGIAPLFMGFLVLLPLNGSDHGYIQGAELAHLVQLLISQFIPDMRVFVPLNLISVCLQLAMITATPVLAANSQIMLSCVISFFFNLFVSLSVRSVLMREAYAVVNEDKAMKSEATVQGLLSVMCDAVVSLKPDMSFREPSPKFASLLMCATDFGGNMNFVKYVCERDVSRFMEFINTSASTARSVHLNLVDCMGTRVPVQVFHTCMLDWLGQPNHLLGLVEDNEPCNGFAKARASFPELETESGGPPRLQGGDETESSVSTGSEDAGSQTPSRDSTLTPRNCARREGPTLSWGGTGPAHFTIRTSLDWHFVSESDTSKTFFNFSQEPSSVTFFSRFRSPANLIRWFEMIHVEAMRGNPLDRYTFGRVGFMDRNSGLEYSAILSADIKKYPMPQSSDSSLDLGLQSVLLEVHLRPPSEAGADRRRRHRRSRAHAAALLRLSE